MILAVFSEQMEDELPLHVCSWRGVSERIGDLLSCSNNNNGCWRRWLGASRHWWLLRRCLTGRCLRRRLD